MGPIANNKASGIPAPEATLANAGNHREMPGQSIIFDLPGVTGADLARAACDGHATDPSEVKSSFIAECSRALLDALANGPCSMAEARARAGLASPDEIDGRAAGAAAADLYRRGLIEPAGWFDRSPWRGCHACPARVWRLPARARQ